MKIKNSEVFYCVNECIWKLFESVELELLLRSAFMLTAVAFK